MTVCRHFSRFGFWGFFFFWLKNILCRVPSDSFSEVILWSISAFTVNSIGNDDPLRRGLGKMWWFLS